MGSLRSTRFPGAAILVLSALLICVAGAYAAENAPPNKPAVTAKAKPAQASPLKSELVVQAGHASPVNVISFSPDSKLLASGSGEDWSFVERNVVIVWDVATGTELRTFVLDRPVKWIGFSRDGRRIAARGDDIYKKTVKTWDIASGAKLPDAPFTDFVSHAKSPDGKIAAEVDLKNIKLREASTGRPLRTLASRTSDFQKLKFSPDSTILACGGERFSIRLWDLRAGVLRTLEGHTDYPCVADFSPDSRLFASGGRDLVVRVWDVASGREIMGLKGHCQKCIRGMHFSPDGKTLLSFDQGEFKLWETKTGRELVSATGHHDDDFSYVLFSPSGDLLAAVVGKSVMLWEATTGKKLREFTGTAGRLAFSPDGKFLMAEGNTEIQWWDVRNGKSISTIQVSAQGQKQWEVRFVRSIFSPDARTVAATEFDSRDKAWKWRLHLRDAQTGRPLHTLDADATKMDPYGALYFTADSKRIFTEGSGKTLTWEVASGRIVENAKRQEHYNDSPNGVYRVAFGEDGELILSEARTGRPLASLIGIDEKDWLVATHEGFFDGSPAAWKQIYWRFNNDAFNYVPLEALFNEFYHPGLLQDVLAGKKLTPPDCKSLCRIDRRQPRVTLARVQQLKSNQGLKPQADRSVTLTVEVEENACTPAQADHPAASGARDVRLFRNGSLVKSWRGDLFALQAGAGLQQLPAVPGSRGRRVRCEVRVPVVAGANEFTVYAFNDANVKSSDATLLVLGAESLRRKPTLHVLAVGVNKYANEYFNLRYAVADAEGFAAEIKRQQAGQQAFGRIETHLLTDGQATKAKILGALGNLARQAQPEDTVIVYFAGHGAAHRNCFYLIPHDLGSADEPARSDDEALAALVQQAVSDRELERAFEPVDAAHFLFVIDACNSGQALETEENRRGPMNCKGLAQLAYEKGMYVLTAAQSSQAALEVSKYGHGLLTYALVEEGLKQGAADTDPKDCRILLREWLDYATCRVPQVQEMRRASRLTEARYAYPMPISDSSASEQRPRVFYRSETDAQPFVVARPDAVAPTPAQRVGELATSRQEPAGVNPERRLNLLLAPVAKSRPLVVALADRTVARQPLTKEIQQQWVKKLHALVDEKSPSFQIAADSAKADVQVQVAALQRPDVVYLTPSKKLLAQPEEELLLMSPPGEKATAWLKESMQRLARPAEASPATADEGDRQRLFLGVLRKGPIEDLKADVVQEQSGNYHTANRTQAILGTYGKLAEGNRLLGQLRRFEHRGLVQQLDQIRRFATVQRLGRGNGKDFVSFVGTRQAWQIVDVSGQVSAGRQSEVAYEVVGLRLDQSDVIKSLNADTDALNYFAYLSSKREVPCVILENLVFTSYSSLQGTNVNVGASAKTILTADGVQAQVATQQNSFTQFTSPVVRCYQMYQVKMYQNQVVELVYLDP